jgi:hypothetical protein
VLRNNWEGIRVDWVERDMKGRRIGRRGVEEVVGGRDWNRVRSVG